MEAIYKFIEVDLSILFCPALFPVIRTSASFTKQACGIQDNGEASMANFVYFQFKYCMS